MVSREVIDDILTKTIYSWKCTLKDILRRFQKNMDNYHTENVSLESIEISPNLIITDEEKIMDMNGIVRDGKREDVLYGALEMRQDKAQKEVNYTFEEKGGVMNYATNDYKLVNGRFYNTKYYQERKGRFENHIDTRIEELDSAIEKSPNLTQDTVLFRYGFFPSGMKVGETGKWKAYTSTSYQEESADKFKNGYDGDSEGRYKIKILAPEGTKGVLVNDTFETLREHEWLLGRNQKYMVLEVNDDTKEVTLGLY